MKSYSVARGQVVIFPPDCALELKAGDGIWMPIQVGGRWPACRSGRHVVGGFFPTCHLPL